ncbi:MAG: hypothetical protein IKV17_05625 [Bacteroidaceae bacterium]|nr:hypothetical protein [Bacteroidaceae bacterium]
MRATITNKGDKYKIWYFVFVFFIIPTIQVSGLTTVIGRLIPNPLGYNLLAFILSLPLLSSYNKNYENLRGVIKVLTLLIIYIFFTFIFTVNKTSFISALTVFRHSFMQAVNLFVLLPFMFSLKKEEVNYTLHCIFKSLIIFIIIYLSNNLVYDWLGVKDSLMENVNGVSIDRSIIGMPLIDPVWSALLITYAIFKVPKANKYLFLILLTIIISFTRNVLFSTFIIAITIITISILRNFKNISRTVKLVSIILLGISFLYILMPNVINFWIAKLSNTFNEDIKYDIGTFAFRERLIEDAIYSIKHNPLFGLGYIRDTVKGEYSMVLGGDTYIAPILWCEGWIGITLRSLPFVILGLNSLFNIIKGGKKYWLDLVIIATITASAINYVQTKALTDYPLILGIIILLKIKDNYDRKSQNFSNYSIL